MTPSKQISIQDAFRLAGELRQVGRTNESAEIYRQILAVRPDFAECHNDLGVVLMQMGQVAEAQASFARAAQLKPDFAEAHNNLGTALTEIDRIEEGLASFRQALVVRPNYPDALNNLATALVDSGRIDEGIAFYRQALALQPDFAQAHHHLGTALLLKGDLINGWAECEWRLRMPGHAIPPLPGASWNGEDSEGRRIFIQAEQGFGDAIQFVRYLPPLRKKGFGEITLLCQPQLLRLFHSLGEGIRLVEPGQELPEFDLYCAMLSLPHRFRTVQETIPAASPYLSADRALAQKWTSRFENDKRIRVGLAWAGSSAYRNDRQRSIAIELLQPLAQVPGVIFVSLQKNRPDVNATTPFELHDWTSELDDFADTAALIENLDLVISVDTAIAHLAGAMGKPVWTMIPNVPDWRWIMDRNDSPWYPTMQLFRQSQRGNWSTVIQAVAENLSRFSPPQ